MPGAQVFIGGRDQRPIQLHERGPQLQDVAEAREAGTGMLMLQVETVLIATTSLMVGACWAAAAYAISAGGMSMAQILTAARTDLLLGLTIVALAPLAASFAAAGTPASLLKER